MNDQSGQSPAEPDPNAFPKPGWYADDEYGRRWWDGLQSTDHVAPKDDGVADDKKQSKPDATPMFSDPNQPWARILGALAVLTALLTAIGIAAGDVGRFAAEKKGWFMAAVILTLLAGTFGVVAAMVKVGGDDEDRKEQSKREARLLGASCLFLVLGLIVATVGVSYLWSDTRRPNVNAVLEQTDKGTFVDVKVVDSGLSSNEHITVLVEPLRRSRSEINGKRSTKLIPADRPVYSASLGADQDGKIDHSVKVRVNPANNPWVGVRAFTSPITESIQSGNCYESDDTLDGCVFVGPLRPYKPLAPQLSAVWNKDRTALEVEVETSGTYETPVRMSAFGKAPGRGSPWRSIARWRMMPDGSGSLKRAISVPVFGGFSRVCVMATARPHASLSCRSSGHPQTAWATYAVPVGADP